MFDLPEEDVDCLAASGRQWESIVDNGSNWVLLPDYPVPEAFNESIATIALLVPPSYPDDQIDMVYIFPPISLKSGKTIGALCDQALDGKTYQRWSRHRTAENPWRPGIDNVCTHLLQVDSWLTREFA